MDGLRGALQSMDSATETPNSNYPTSFAAEAPYKLRVDPAIVDAISAAVINGASVQKATAAVVGVGKSHTDTQEQDAAVRDKIRNELRRLAVLKSYRVIGSSGRNPAYERLISLTSRVFKVPIAYISVIDLEKQHYLASRGLGGSMGTENARNASICAHAIASDDDLFVVPDLTKNPLFQNHQNVVGIPYLRFYASAPLVCPEKYRLGTLCILDTEPRPEGLSFNMKQNLREIADMVMDVMVEEVSV
jgi:GAF domain-containing protein